MKKIFTILMLLFISKTANADTLLRFKDGSANVWENTHDKGNQLCTWKGQIELCIFKNDIAYKKEVPEGTDPKEYGSSAPTNLPKQSDRIGANEYAEMTSRKKEALNKDDKERSKKRGKMVEVYGEEKVTQMEIEKNSQAIQTKKNR